MMFNILLLVNKVAQLGHCLSSLVKVSKKCLIPHFSYRAWKYESNDGLVEGLSALLAVKIRQN